MKTIFITSFHPLISRNILSTDILKILKDQKNLRIVIFTVDYKKPYFEKEFAGINIIIEGMRAKPLSGLSLFFTHVALVLLNTPTMRIKARGKLEQDKNYFNYFIARLGAIMFGRSKTLRRLARFFDYTLAPKETFKKYVDTYKPSLVFSTDVLNDNDIKLLQEARSSCVRTIGMVRSWDNFSAKGVMRILPQKLIVSNEILKKEAVDYNDMESEDIFVAGIPHYDFYINHERTPRQKFFQEIGADPNKKLILFAPTGDRYIRDNNTDWQILDILKKAILEKVIPANSQVLVRFPPGDTCNLNNFVPPDFMIFDRPGTVFNSLTFKDRDLSHKDDVRLADSLYYSDVVISGPSTIMIDGAVFNKPIILINFDGWTKRDYFDSISRHYDSEHISRVAKGGGVRLVDSKEELIKWTNNYLGNPRLDEKERKQMIKEQACYLDGRSSERVARFLLETV